MRTLLTSASWKRSLVVWSSSASLALASLLLVRTAEAQTVPATAPQPEPPVMVVDAPPPAPAPAMQTPPPPAQPDVRELTRQLLVLEAQSAALEQQIKGVRTRWVRVGKILSWTATTMFLVSALGAYGSAEQIKEALEDGRDDKVYDYDGDKEVDRQDERRARRVARGLAIGSLVPIGLGIWSTILHRKRLHQQRSLGFQLEDVSYRRRSLLQRLDAQLGASQQHAALQLKLTF